MYVKEQGKLLLYISSVAKCIVAWSMLRIVVNNDHHMLDVYQLDFTNDLLARNYVLKHYQKITS